MTTPYFALSPKLVVNVEKPKPKRKSIDDIPERIRFGWALRLYGLGSLAWDYADTVIDCSIILRISETRKLSRAVRSVKSEYDYMRSRFLNYAYLEKETSIGLEMEEQFHKHLQKLHYGLKTEINKLHLEDMYAQLVEAVYQCLTILKAMKLYAKDCDRQIGNPKAHSILPDHFNALYDLISEFAGDVYDPNLSVCDITANILYNELKTFGIYDNTGKL